MNSDLLEVAFLTWGYYLIFALLPSLPIVWLGRRRVNWRFIDLLAFVLPFMVWFALTISPLAEGRKTLANLGEPLVFGIAVPVTAVGRVFVGRKLSDSRCRAIFIGTLCLVAAGTFFFTPPWPE